MQYIAQIHPFALKYDSEELWHEFFGKYMLMVKEKLIVYQRNQSRQRRSNRRFFNDLQVLVQDANYTDEVCLRQKNIRVTPSNTIGLSITIGMTLECMTRHLEHSFQQELIRVEELPMHFHQARYIY